MAVCRNVVSRERLCGLRSYGTERLPLSPSRHLHRVVVVGHRPLSTAAGSSSPVTHVSCAWTSPFETSVHVSCDHRDYCHVGIRIDGGKPVGVRNHAHVVAPLLGTYDATCPCASPVSGVDARFGRPDFESIARFLAGIGNQMNHRGGCSDVCRTKLWDSRRYKLGFTSCFRPDGPFILFEISTAEWETSGNDKRVVNTS